MATEAQTSANRTNAQKSTGPRTPEGKAVAARNAVKHGLLAREVVLQGEDLGEFELCRQELLEELAPAGPLEWRLAERIVGLSWRLRRAERLHGAALGTLAEEKKKWVWSQEDKQYVILQAAPPGRVVPGSEEEALAVDRRIVQDFAQTRIFDRLLGYERRIEHSLYRTMAELRGLRKEKGVPSSKCEAASLKLENPVSSTPSLPPSHCPPAISGGTPNTLEAGSQWCETNPIWGGVSSLKCQVASELCETNPICPAPTAQMPHPPTMPAFQDSPLRPQAQGQACETNPISGGVSSLKCQVTSESCETNPICGSPRGTGILPVDANPGRDAHPRESFQVPPSLLSSSGKWECRSR
jgi:hypothetical protein